MLANSQPLIHPYAFSDQYIAGKWRAGSAGTSREDTNPYTGDVLVVIPDASVEDVNEAFVAAQNAQPLWARYLPEERAQIMRRAAQIMEVRQEEILGWLIRETGSTRIKANAEWTAVRSIILEASTLPTRLEGRILGGDIAGKENRVYRVPVGVVAIISPWNWPMHLSSRSMAPALALGNSVVLKPANESAVTGGLLLAKLFEEAGLPAGVLNVVVGESNEIGDPFVLHPIARVISFTGSNKVGRRVGELAVTGPALKRTMLELGGNNPLVVLEDADLERAVHAAVVGKFLHQGQICVIANRLIVHDSLYDAFVDLYVERVKKLKVGDPNDPDTVVGPVISQRQMETLRHMLQYADADGARLLVGGDIRDLLMPPHVFAEVTMKMRLAQNEIFGPIAPILRAKDEEDALQIANDTEFGLSSAVFTKDVDRGLRFAQRLEAGMTHINDLPTVDLASMPFGGQKNSGLGRFGSDALIQELTSEHWISVQHEPRQYPF